MLDESRGISAPCANRRPLCSRATLRAGGDVDCAPAEDGAERPRAAVSDDPRRGERRQGRTRVLAARVRARAGETSYEPHWERPSKNGTRTPNAERLQRASACKVARLVERRGDFAPRVARDGRGWSEPPAERAWVHGIGGRLRPVLRRIAEGQCVASAAQRLGLVVWTRRGSRRHRRTNRRSSSLSRSVHRSHSRSPVVGPPRRRSRRNGGPARAAERARGRAGRRSAGGQPRSDLKIEGASDRVLPRANATASALVRLRYGENVADWRRCERTRGELLLIGKRIRRSCRS
jgi:hypothetical protein